MAAARLEGELVLVWAEVLGAQGEGGMLSVRRYSRDAPRGVGDLVPRSAAVFPLTEASFEAARREGWPERRRAVQTLAGVVRGGVA